MTDRIGSAVDPHRIRLRDQQGRQASHVTESVELRQDGQRSLRAARAECSAGRPQKLLLQLLGRQWIRGGAVGEARGSLNDCAVLEGDDQRRAVMGDWLRSATSGCT